MSSILPIDVQALLHFRGVESSRVEFKASWDSKAMAGTAAQVLRTICAYANDVQNLNGGYIVVGVSETSGKAVLPLAGLSIQDLDLAQKWIQGNCNHISPVYQPVLSPEVVDGKDVLVIWAPGGDNRPYQAPESLAAGAPRHFYIRQGAETVEAKGEMLRTLMQLTAKVPFDDRRALDVPVEQISMVLIRRHLQNLGSGLAADADDRDVLRRMRITMPVNGHEVPRNVALLMFTEDPERWFPGARIEVAHFAGDARGNLIEERTFRGPLTEQIREGIGYLQNLSIAHFQKVPDHAQTRGWVSYPLAALEESVVNAVYHRSYEGQSEPVKIYLYPDRMQIISYPGPVPGIEPKHLQPGGRVPPVPARNRRIGEFLKELRLAESRGTGIPKVFDAMARNGSSPPCYEFDTQRTYFSVTLPAHPEYVAITALRDVAQLDAVGDKEGAVQRLQQAYEAQPSSGSVAAKLIETHSRRADLAAARAIYDSFFKRPDRRLPGRVIVAMANACIEANQLTEAKQVLDGMPQLLVGEEAIEAAVLERRAGRDDRAHNLFQQARDTVLQDARALHEFAQTKMRLSHSPRYRGRRGDVHARTARRLLWREAKEMLQRVLQLDAGPQRHAWAWYDFGRVCRWLGEPAENSQQAFLKARELAPQDNKLLDLLDRQDETSP